MSSDLSKPGINDDFEKFLTKAYEYLVNQQEICEEKFGLGQMERWYYDETKGVLTFHIGDTTKLKIKYQMVGSVSKISETWLWGWANPNSFEGIASEMQKVRRVGEKRKFERLTKRKWKADEVDGWEMTAIAAYVLKAKGAYRVPTEKTYSYFVFLEIEEVNEIEKRK